MIIQRKPIIRIIKEDETDDANDIMNGEMSDNGNDYSDTTSSGNDETVNNADNNTDENNEESSEDNSNNEDSSSSGGDDFSIDTSLDGVDNNDDSSSSDSDSSSDSYSSSSTSYSSDSSDVEVNQANTDIFTSLTAEEQSIKIMELKNLYNKLYTQCNDYLVKINNIEIDAAEQVITLNRITSILSQLKIYIRDYLIKTFAYKSYIQNDIMFNRFLTIFNSSAVIIEKMVKNNKNDEISSNK